MTRRLSDHERKLWKQVARTVPGARSQLPGDDPEERKRPLKLLGQEIRGA
jgi:hypothetical protein